MVDPYGTWSPKQKRGLHLALIGFMLAVGVDPVLGAIIPVDAHFAQGTASLVCGVLAPIGMVLGLWWLIAGSRGR